jgi:hypothetical protein
MVTKGTNIITMLKVNEEGKGAGSGKGTWKISGVFDTSATVPDHAVVPKVQGTKE